MLGRIQGESLISSEVGLGTLSAFCSWLRLKGHDVMIDFFGRLLGQDWQERQRRIDDLLERAGLPPKSSRRTLPPLSRKPSSVICKTRSESGPHRPEEPPQAERTDGAITAQSPAPSVRLSFGFRPMFANAQREVIEFGRDPVRVSATWRVDG